MASTDRNAAGKATDRVLHKWAPMGALRTVCGRQQGDCTAQDEEVNCKVCLRLMARATNRSVSPGSD